MAQHFEGLGIAEASARAEEAVTPPAKPDIDARKCEERYTFPFRYVGRGGKDVREGTLTNTILSLKQRRQLAVLRAQLAGGMPVASIDAFTAELNLITAHLQLSLEAPLPAWLDFDNIKDVNLLYALWKEVDSHESTFFGS